MAGNVNDTSGCENDHFDKLDSEKNDDHAINGEEDDSMSSESEALLPARKGGISRGIDKTERKVRWNDRNGDNLAEVLMYDPSDVSDSDDEDKDSCFCCIM